MRGCIIKDKEISLKDICGYIKKFNDYNWLITNVEVYSNNNKLQDLFSNEYCWIEGKKLYDIFRSEECLWIWGVFSAFPKSIKLDDVKKYDLPYADGYMGFWKTPVSVQTPLTAIEIVVWDGTLFLIISKEDALIEKIIEKMNAKDLDIYNAINLK